MPPPAAPVPPRGGLFPARGGLFPARKLFPPGQPFSEGWLFPEDQLLVASRPVPVA